MAHCTFLMLLFPVISENGAVKAMRELKSSYLGSKYLVYTVMYLFVRKLCAQFTYIMQLVLRHLTHLYMYKCVHDDFRP